jgi:Phycobilisome degradation protein nblA
MFQIELTLNQRLHLRDLEIKIDRMSPDQLKEFSLNIALQLMLKDAYIKELYKDHLGIDSISHLKGDNYHE